MGCKSSRVGRHSRGYEMKRQRHGLRLGSVGHGDKYGHYNIHQEMAHHQKGEKTKAEGPSATLAPCHVLGTNTRENKFGWKVTFEYSRKENKT